MGAKFRQIVDAAAMVERLSRLTEKRYAEIFRLTFERDIQGIKGHDERIAELAEELEALEICRNDFKDRLENTPENT